MKYQLEDCASATIIPSMGTKKQKKGTSAAKRKTWTIDPPDDLRSLVEVAMEATGADRSTLLFKCIRKELREVVREMREELEKERRAVEELRNELGVKSGGQDKSK